MKKMNIKEMNNCQGGKRIYSCIFNDYSSENYWKVYGHALWHCIKKGYEAYLDFCVK